MQSIVGEGETSPLDIVLGFWIILIMTFPLEELIKCEKNMYELTCAASRRAYQLSMLRSNDYDVGEEKVVSLAARQVFTEEVKFTHAEEETNAIPELLSGISRR